MPLNPVGASTKLNNAAASKGNPDAVAAMMTGTTTTTGCTCTGGVNAGTAAFNNNKKDNSGKVTLETILSSNTKFQAISAIAVAQDGVVNIADQGKLNLTKSGHSKCYKKLLWSSQSELKCYNSL